MIEQSIDPQPKFLNSCCNLPSNFQKISWMQVSETGKSCKQTKVVKITKKNIFKPFFDMMEQKIDPPN